MDIHHHICLVRPGLIVGPFDVSDRFAYWVRRIDEGGAVVAPEGPDYPTQFIDVRDLADFVLHLITSGMQGTFNADGPVVPLGMLLETIQASSSLDSRIVYVSKDVLEEQGVQPWSQLPLWIPGLSGTNGSTDTQKALHHGLLARAQRNCNCHSRMASIRYPFGKVGPHIDKRKGAKPSVNSLTGLCSNKCVHP